MNISAELIAIGILGVALVSLGGALVRLGWKVSSDIRHELKQEIHYVREDVADVRKVVADLREQMARLEGLFEGFHQGRIDRGKEVTGASPQANARCWRRLRGSTRSRGAGVRGSMIQNSCPPDAAQALFFQARLIVIH